MAVMGWPTRQKVGQDPVTWMSPAPNALAYWPMPIPRPSAPAPATSPGPAPTTAMPCDGLVLERFTDRDAFIHVHRAGSSDLAADGLEKGAVACCPPPVVSCGARSALRADRAPHAHMLAPPLLGKASTP